ncbi:MAG: substrate-binding domain-containing protein [Ancrocorticia sp.]|uniref:substrate-binding domain-containing protein n=1 Tax=Ancrocorticia sp. TaxID=2593684 RepID=UPI003F9076A3
MKRRFTGLAAIAAAAALTLSACGGDGGRGGDDAGSDSTDDAVTLAEGDTIGVSLPWLGTQNWKEADQIFKTDLDEAGYNAIVQAADNKVPNQQSQIEAMIEQGAKVLIVGPIDGTQLGSVLEQAQASGITIIGYDRMIENTEAVDGVVQFGSIKTGEFQAQALLQGLEEEKGDGPYNIELFAGGPADPNAQLFFDGAMSVLQPKIDDGTLVVVSGQTDFTQAATQDWDNGKAQSRMDSILSGNYSNEQIDGVLSPNDGIARAIITSAEQAGQDIPVVSGLDAENESIAWIASGKQYSTVAKPTQEMVDQTMDILDSLAAGDGLPEANDTADNGAKEVPVYALEPTVVTLDNLEEFFADNEDIMAIINDNK